MPAWFQFPFLFGIPVLPARRVVAIDAGARAVKVVLAELFLNRVRILRRAHLERPAAGAAPGDFLDRWQALWRELGRFPVALALPQHVTLSQVIDLPHVAEPVVQRLIQNEIHKLGGLSQSRITCDHAPLRPFGRHDHAFWVSLCQEHEIAERMDRLALEREDLCEVTSAGNALQTAYLALFPETSATVLVDLGLRSTTMVILVEGQAVHAASFALGTELFTETLAAAKGCSLDDAERLKHEQNLLQGPAAVPEFRAAVAGWRQELLRLVQEWLEEHPALRLGVEAFQFVLSGGGAAQPGLTEFLSQSPNAPSFSLWPAVAGLDSRHPPGSFAVAEGAALQALGQSPQPTSLLPVDLRKLWRQQRTAQLIQSISFFLLLLLLFLLAAGTWQKLSLAGRKRALQAEAVAALERVDKTREMDQQVKAGLERLRPLLERQQLTLDTLQTLSLVQQARSNRSLWFVLFADDQSYFGVPVSGATNEPAATNALAPGATGPPPAAATTTNRPSVRAGFVAEVCIPEDGEAMRRTLSQLVGALKQSPRLRNVDTVPQEQRRPLADPKTILPDHHFALALELATNEFQPSLRGATNQAGAAPRLPGSAALGPVTEASSRP